MASPKVISIIPNRNLFSPKVIFVTPKVITLEVFFYSLMKSMEFINDFDEIH